MTYALMGCGGKNSTLALDRARRNHVDVAYLMTVYGGTQDRARFHGTQRLLVERYANSLGLEPIAIQTSGYDLGTAFEEQLGALAGLGVHGVIFGDINLESVRSWYEERVKAAGLDHVEPNWGGPSIEVAWEVVERGYQALVVSVNRAARSAKLLGREFDADMVTEIGCMDAIDPSGERGEYHTFVFDGPSFESPVEYSVGEEFENEGHRVIDLITAANA